MSVMPGSIGHPGSLPLAFLPRPTVGEGRGEGESEKAFTLTFILSHQGRGNFERAKVRQASSVFAFSSNSPSPYFPLDAGN